jgi:hypothetical protein
MGSVCHPGLVLGWAAADGVDWLRQHHAYGVASDTPGHLRALVGGDRQAQFEAVDHLQVCVLHQGGICSATPIAVRVVAGLLGDPALRRDGPDGQIMLASLVEFIGTAAEALMSVTRSPESVVAPDAAKVAEFYRRLNADDRTAWTLPVAGALTRRARVEVLAAVPELVGAVGPFDDDTDLDVRLTAIWALARLGLLAPDGAAAGLIDRFRTRLGLVTGREERASLLLALGLLGADTTSWLDDPDPAVRACAALSSRDDAKSTPILIDALLRPREIGAWFRPDLLFFRRVHTALLRELLSREVPFRDLLPAALAMVPLGDAYTPDDDWGLLLLAAFPDVPFEAGIQPPPPTTLDDAQRALLRALVANRRLWDPNNGNAHLARMRVGLPHTQRAVTRLTKTTPPR